jgi:hypothetical protein
MVKFTFLPVSDSRLSAAQKAQFLNVGQLIQWEVNDTSGTYTGLLVIGEKGIPQGFQTFADVTIDIGDRKELPMAKVQELSQIVQTEFKQRAIINLKKPGNA